MIDITVTDIRIQRGAGDPGTLNRGEPDLDETDDILRIGKASGTAVFRDKTYVDDQDAATLTAAEGYADTGDASTLTAAEAYADTGDAATLAAANAYTDTAVAGGGGTGLNDYGTY